MNNCGLTRPNGDVTKFGPEKLKRSLALTDFVECVKLSSDELGLPPRGLYYAAIDQELQLRFIQSIEDSIERILESPSRWRALDEAIRRYVVHVFPYGILYTVENDFVLIVAVMHFSREPSYWKDRIS